jgi:4-aminobutyrate aminotransferase-like enzyme
MNILKLRPPMPFSRGNADLAVGTLAEVLKDIPA